MERPIISIEGEYDLNERPLFKPILFSAEALDLEQHAWQELLGIRNCTCTIYFHINKLVQTVF